MYDVINMPDLIVRYFSSTPWLVAFIVSTVYLFIRLNAAKKRALFVVVLVFFLFVNTFVIKAFTKLGQNSTFYRHLWGIPSIVIVGLAVVDLIRIIPKWYLKIPAIVAIAVGLWFINGQEIIRCRIQLFSTNANLVQDDVVAIGDKLEDLRKESGKSTLFVVCPSGYDIPYGSMPSELSLYCGFLSVRDASVMTGEAELMGDNPDVGYIMSTCCSNGMDFVIVSNNSNAEDAFRNAGYEPEITTDSFNLYKCEGFPGYRVDITAAGRVSWRSWYDENGEPTSNEMGYCTETYTYQRLGRRTIDSYYDTEGNPCIAIGNGLGYARLERKYNSYGLLEEERFYDTEGNPCTKTNYGYSIMRNYYNGRVLIKQCYYNEKEELIICESNEGY